MDGAVLGKSPGHGFDPGICPGPPRQSPGSPGKTRVRFFGIFQIAHFLRNVLSEALLLKTPCLVLSALQHGGGGA